MGLKAAIQALKKAEELKAKVSRHNDLLNNSEAWSDQQQLQTIYHQVLVLDLEYALDKKVEQELWTLGFKNHIAALQQLSRDKKNPRRSECQALLSWCLEAASGFYLTLLQELCTAFELDLPFRRRGAVYGETKHCTNSEQLTQPHKSSCLYICQYCLVHLGDIARYRSERKQAESFYRHAILLSPSSGQPYNQLALLEASRGDKLATVFHYVRSISVKYPFSAASTNLLNTLSALIDNDDPLTDSHSKLSLAEFISVFLRTHALLHLATDLDHAEQSVKALNATFTALVATQIFSSMKLIQMMAINLYMLRHTVDSMKAHQLTPDELRVKAQVLELLAGGFSAYLLPIYTMNDDDTLLDYYALPAIKLTLDWIKTEPVVLSNEVFIKRLQIWPSLCKLLNSLQNHIGDFTVKSFEKLPLPEDRDLQSFLPLASTFKNLDFSTDNLNKDTGFFNKLRIARLVTLGCWLATQTVNNASIVTAKKLNNPNRILFEPANKLPDPTTELLEELKHFNIKEKEDNKDVVKPIKSIEKRGGILKPQGSLEKAREEREQALLLSVSENGDSSSNTSLNSSTNSTRSDSSKLKRSRQNVALQALAKKVEENSKQVTFQTELIKPKEKPKNDIKLVETPKKLTELPKSEGRPPLLHLPTAPKTDINLSTAIGSFPSQQNNMPLNYNQSTNFGRVNMNIANLPFQVQYQNNVPFHNLNPLSNSLMNPTSLQSNLTTSSLQSVPPLTYPRFSSTNTSNFSVPFDVSQNVGYQNLPAKEYSPWLPDEKLPTPPPNWWANSKNISHFPSESFNQNYSYGLNSFGQDVKLPQDFGRQSFGGLGTGSYNKMNMWNSAPVNSNLQMLMSQSSSQNFTEPSLQLNREDSNPTSNITNENQTNSMPGYSLFNSNWAPNLTAHSTMKGSPPDKPPLVRQQSLFSGPGPSPLERLLEQQKQLRGFKEDT